MGVDRGIIHGDYRDMGLRFRMSIHACIKYFLNVPYDPAPGSVSVSKIDMVPGLVKLTFRHEEAVDK